MEGKNMTLNIISYLKSYPMHDTLTSLKKEIRTEHPMKSLKKISEIRAEQSQHIKLETQMYSLAQGLTATLPGCT
jgi:hypothetical protein